MLSKISESVGKFLHKNDIEYHLARNDIATIFADDNLVKKLILKDEMLFLANFSKIRYYAPYSRHSRIIRIYVETFNNRKFEEYIGILQYFNEKLSFPIRLLLTELDSHLNLNKYYKNEHFYTTLYRTVIYPKIVNKFGIDIKLRLIKESIDFIHAKNLYKAFDKNTRGSPDIIDTLLQKYPLLIEIIDPEFLQWKYVCSEDNKFYVNSISKLSLEAKKNLYDQSRHIYMQFVKGGLKEFDSNIYSKEKQILKVFEKERKAKKNAELQEESLADKCSRLEEKIKYLEKKIEAIDDSQMPAGSYHLN